MNRARTAILTAGSLLSGGALAGCSAVTGPATTPPATTQSLSSPTSARLPVASLERQRVPWLILRRPLQPDTRSPSAA